MLSKSERDKIVHRLKVLFKKRLKISKECNIWRDKYPTDPEQEAHVDELDEILDRKRPLSREQSQLRKQYQKGLPILPLSRCPFTGEIWKHTLDIYGLDSPFWEDTHPLRGDEEDQPYGGKYAFFTGSIKLNHPEDDFYWNRVTFYEKPFVIPSLMRGKYPLTPVIMPVDIGEHEGHIIVYFGDFEFLHFKIEFDTVNLPGDWGCYTHYSTKASNDYIGYHIEGKRNLVNFNLDPYLEKNRIYWIDKNDKTMTLRQGLNGCPFAGSSNW